MQGAEHCDFLFRAKKKVAQRKVRRLKRRRWLARATRRSSLAGCGSDKRAQRMFYLTHHISSCVIERNMTQLHLALSCISIRLAAKLAPCARTVLRRSGSGKEGVRPIRQEAGSEAHAAGRRKTRAPRSNKIAAKRLRERRCPLHVNIVVAISSSFMLFFLYQLILPMPCSDTPLLVPSILWLHLQTVQDVPLSPFDMSHSLRHIRRMQNHHDAATA